MTGQEREAAYERIAKEFHQAYEELAPVFGYRTREESGKPWKDVPRANQMLMVATVRALIEEGVIDFNESSRAALTVREEPITVWTCMSCGQIGNAQACGNCGHEAMPGRWLEAEGVEHQLKDAWQQRDDARSILVDEAALAAREEQPVPEAPDLEGRGGLELGRLLIRAERAERRVAELERAAREESQAAKTHEYALPNHPALAEPTETEIEACLDAYDEAVNSVDHWRARNVIHAVLSTANSYRAALTVREEPTEPVELRRRFLNGKIRAAARAAFDYANESDEYSDRFDMWWSFYVQEESALAAREDTERPDRGATT